MGDLMIEDFMLVFGGFAICLGGMIGFAPPMISEPGTGIVVTVLGILLIVAPAALRQRR